MLALSKEVQTQPAIWQRHVFAPVGSLQRPAPPCPENGILPSPLSNCGLPEFPATTLPFPGDMAYSGGHVQTAPKEYLVFWGWGEKGAFPAGQTCTSENVTGGSFTATLACDPDGTGKDMADFVQQMGGTEGDGVQPSTTRPTHRARSRASPTRASSWPGSGSTTLTTPPGSRAPRRGTRRCRPTPTRCWPRRRRAR